MRSVDWKDGEEVELVAGWLDSVCGGGGFSVDLG